MTDASPPVTLDRSECEALVQLWYATDLAPQGMDRSTLGMDRSTLEYLRKRVDAYLTTINKDKT